VSTASGGKFDAALPGEKPGERAPAGKRKRPLVDAPAAAAALPAADANEQTRAT